MATDYAEKEREFIGSLEADTGRALSGWMQAITDAGFKERNDIIDWLRQMGFTFSNASWLERIHHNGGRLVYADSVPPLSPAPPKVASQRLRDAPKPVMPTQSDVVAPLPLLVHPATALFDADVLEVLSAAKGLRPLAMLALNEISGAVAGTAFSAEGPLLVMAAPRPYLALLPGAKALRIYGDFGTPAPDRISRAEATMKIASKAAPPFSQVLVLTDARLVDAVFTSLVKTAHTRAGQ
ncbi:MAG: hypothetical protein ABL897_01315 [Hyphomicrobium sp.]